MGHPKIILSALITGYRILLNAPSYQRDGAGIHKQRAPSLSLRTLPPPQHILCPRAGLKATASLETMSKPTVILVPGAWHTPRHYEKLLELLRTAGFTTVSKQLPSVGSDQPTEQTVASDAAFIRESLLLPELDRGQDVILIMHSYGGSPGSAAAKGLSKAERLASGQKGGIVGLVFICAFLANEGDSLQSKLPGQKLDPWCLIDVRREIKVDLATGC